EAVAIGKIAAYILPSLDVFELYRIAGRPVYLPQALIGLGLTALLTVLNYRGIGISASFQNWTTVGTMALFAVFVAFGGSKGSAANLPPLFTHSGFISVLLVMQIVPYYMTGYESVGKAAEERSADFRGRGFLAAIWMAILVGILFYTSVVAAVAYAAPWRNLTAEKFMTAVAFERAMGSHWIVLVILVSAFLSLFKVFNGNLVAASRLIFAMGRRGFLDDRFGAVHPRNQTPSVAVTWVGVATALCMFLGDAILVPISEVGSVASAAGWLAACAAYYRITTAARGRLVAGVGIAVCLGMILMKIVPAIPGHFNGYEWLALTIWAATGVGLGWRQRALSVASAP